MMKADWRNRMIAPFSGTGTYTRSPVHGYRTNLDTTNSFWRGALHAVTKSWSQSIRPPGLWCRNASCGGDWLLWTAVCCRRVAVRVRQSREAQVLTK